MACGNSALHAQGTGFSPPTALRPGTAQSLSSPAATLSSPAPILSPGAAFDPDKPLALIGKQPIVLRDLGAETAQQLDAARANYELQLEQLGLDFARKRQAAVEKALDGMLDQRVLALEAAARKSTPEALLAAVKVPTVTDAGEHAFFVAQVAQTGKPFATVEPQIKDFLTSQAADTAHRQYLDQLRAKYMAVITLQPLRDAVAATGPSRGPADAPVTLVEFSDFQCPYCGRFAPTLEALLAKYPTQVRLVYRHLPLSTLHPFAEKAAEAAVCADEQGRFWPMYALLFKEQDALGVEALKEKSRRLKLDSAKFDACLDSGEGAGPVQRDTDAARRLAVAGTPTTFINGRYWNGTASLDDLSRLIDDELRRAAPAVHR
jgi:protein-disulfide isomerase